MNIDNKLKGVNLPGSIIEIAEISIDILFILIYPLLTRRGSHTPNISLISNGHVFPCQVGHRSV